MATFLQHKFSGAGAPSTTPARLNDHYTNTVTGDAYISVGTTSSADWKIVAGPTLAAYSTVNCPAGTDPVASGTNDTLNITSSDSSVVVTGTEAGAGLDNIDFAVDGENVVADNINLRKMILINM